jgi:hypothetical protein
MYKNTTEESQKNINRKWHGIVHKNKQKELNK